MFRRIHSFPRLIALATVLLTFPSERSIAGDFDQFLKPLFEENCIKCHGEEKVKGKVNLEEITTVDQFRGRPALIDEMIEVIDAYDMPPEDEPELDEPVREKLLVTLKAMLKEAAGNDGKLTKLGVRRLNRFQYNNAVRDLFQLNRDVFPLPEKLMTRFSSYLHSRGGVMPDVVQVSSNTLREAGGFQGVQPYPKDLRAAHGFDNQANQLTLSPLLLEAYLRLSLSIFESPDFIPQNVGIWKEFFEAPPAGSDPGSVIRERLAPILQQAFRAPVGPAALERYSDYTRAKIEGGLSFTDAMKKGASAILCSPLFLYRYDAPSPEEEPYELASRLSFFLWGSAPDAELLALAESGELSDPGVLNPTIDRMIADPKIEGFLDSFPSQWMQLENLFGVAPDPNIYPQYNLPGGFPASVQMVLEPLLLFDTVFVENRPVIDLIKPEFAYRSDFLRTWYEGAITPSQEFRDEVAKELRLREETRSSLTEKIATLVTRQDALTASIRERLLAAKRLAHANPSRMKVDLKPYAAWEFNGDLAASVSSLDLIASGDISFESGSVVLDKSYLESPKLPVDLKARTLEVWCTLPVIKQRGGGVMTLQGPRIFDSIVYGERKARHWISGSNGHARTLDFVGGAPEENPDVPLHLVMVYQEDGTTTLYRNGRPYGESFNKGGVTFPKDETSLLFGLRHLPAKAGKHLSVRIDKARLYDRALTAREVATAGEEQYLWVSDQEITEAMISSQKAELDAIAEGLEVAKAALKKLPKANPKKPIDLVKETQDRFNRTLIAKASSRTFRRVPTKDPRYGGIITNAATLTMTSAPTRTLPIARGAWMIEVVFNDPPPPPPNDVPPLDEESGPENMTIREKFAQHRENPDCAGCHARIDPLGFALENFDIAGRWRDRYENDRDVDASGTLMKKYDFAGIVDFKESLVSEESRFARAFVAHLLRFALARELTPADSLVIDDIILKTEPDGHKLKDMIREVILCKSFLDSKEGRE